MYIVTDGRIQLDCIKLSLIHYDNVAHARHNVCAVCRRKTNFPICRPYLA